MAAEANIDMLRVWGGGIYEDKSFWDACDRYGILVWQDFMFGCSLYPQDQPFLNNVTAEAESVVRAFRGHVCLAAWCGDNEIDTLCGPESGTIISREVLKEVVSRLDGSRPYIVSSPFSEPGRHPNDPESGDCHLWRHTIRPDDPFYTAKSANFVSEMGRISFPDQETIDTFVPADKQWPPNGPLWYYHSSDTNRWRRYRNVADVLESVRNNGYREPENIEELIESTQKIQADAYTCWIEHFGGDPQCWGLLLWNLCDIWPQISDAIISYDLRPKKAYNAVRSAYGALGR
jgi:beta-mannosidase